MVCKMYHCQAWGHSYSSTMSLPSIFPPTLLHHVHQRSTIIHRPCLQSQLKVAQASSLSSAHLFQCTTHCIICSLHMPLQHVTPPPLCQSPELYRTYIFICIPVVFLDSFIDNLYDHTQDYDVVECVINLIQKMKRGAYFNTASTRNARRQFWDICGY